MNENQLRNKLKKDEAFRAKVLENLSIIIDDPRVVDCEHEKERIVTISSESISLNLNVKPDFSDKNSNIFVELVNTPNDHLSKDFWYMLVNSKLQKFILVCLDSETEDRRRWLNVIEVLLKNLSLDKKLLYVVNIIAESGEIRFWNDSNESKQSLNPQNVYSKLMGDTNEKIPLNCILTVFGISVGNQIYKNCKSKSIDGSVDLATLRSVLEDCSIDYYSKNIDVDQTKLDFPYILPEDVASNKGYLRLNKLINRESRGAIKTLQGASHVLVVSQGGITRAYRTDCPKLILGLKLSKCQKRNMSF